MTDERSAKPTIVLVRHGETEWTITGKHTSSTDVPLSENGRREASLLRRRLGSLEPVAVLTSPRTRAIETCRLAGYGDGAQSSDDLAEWHYGDYEGRTTADIRSAVPEWTLWHHGAPNGETAPQVGARADRVLARLRDVDGTALLFAHGHLLRVMAARWVGLEPAAGRFLALAPASVSALGWEREQRVISLWNDTHP